MIDFVLSSMVNSGIQSMAIFTTYPYSSLLDHLESGKNWNLSRKRDGLFFFPSPNLDDSECWHWLLYSFCSKYGLFYKGPAGICIIANCYTIFNMDFRPVLEKHIDNGCDITEISQNGRTLRYVCSENEFAH